VFAAVILLFPPAVLLAIAGCVLLFGISLCTYILKGNHALLEHEVGINFQLVQPRRNKSEVYGILRKGDEEKGDREYAPSSSHPFEHE
jgi:hypothetical protein